MSETAKLAHLVIPGASFLEKDGTFTNLERRIQRIRKAVEPPERHSAGLASGLRSLHPDGLSDAVRASRGDHEGDCAS